MKLTRMRMRNFRCYKDEIAIDFDDITAFVGENDIGKSSIMDALDIFLNDGAPDKHDATKGGDGKDLTIICEFDDLPAEVVIDDTNVTKLSDEFLLNPEGKLEIHKTYSGHIATPKCMNICAYAVHPTIDGVKDLLQLKNAELKKRAKELGVDVSGVDQKFNAPIRNRIREKFGDLKVVPTLVPLNDDNAKNIWEGLNIYLPVFALFKSDRQSTDQDPEAQDPLKAAVKEAIKAKEVELAAITQYIEQEVRKVADKTVEKTKEMAPALASKLNPQFTPPKWDTLFKASITGDDEIPLNKRGSGIRRLILLNFFRAKAELQAKDQESSRVIYGVEEPETSQHPHNQRLLVRAFMEISIENQVILTTHTPMLARSLPDSNLRYVQIKNAKCREILKGGVETNRLFVKSLGVLPDNSVRLFIGVEGKHDISFLRNISKILRRGGEDVLDLEKMELDGEIIFFPLGGSSLALWTSRLANLNRPEFHLFDRDNPPPQQPKYQSQIDEINKRIGCKAQSTTKKEMENYLHCEAINMAYASNGINLNLTANFSDFDDVPIEIAKKVHQLSGSATAWGSLTDDRRKDKISAAKIMLNEVASSLMTKAQIDEIDPHGAILNWFAAMKKII
jgi:putative ATP-dependent endonuclease of the OLD family